MSAFQSELKMFGKFIKNVLIIGLPTFGLGCVNWTIKSAKTPSIEDLEKQCC